MLGISLGEIMKRLTLEFKHLTSNFLTPGWKIITHTNQFRCVIIKLNNFKLFIQDQAQCLHFPYKYAYLVVLQGFIILHIKINYVGHLMIDLLFSPWMMTYSREFFNITSYIRRALIISTWMGILWPASLWYFIFKWNRWATTSSVVRNNLLRMVLYTLSHGTIKKVTFMFLLSTPLPK